MIDESLITIEPSDCSFVPEFSISKDTYVKQDNKYAFYETGVYNITCKVRGGKDETYFKTDTLKIKVVDAMPSFMGIQVASRISYPLYVGENVDISTIANIRYPTNAELKISTTENIKYENGTISALAKGDAIIYISIVCNGIAIYDKATLKVYEPKAPELISITFEYAGNYFGDGDTITLSKSKIYRSINYQLLNADSQSIICTSSNPLVAEIISFNSPLIIINAKSIGSCLISISPEGNSNIIFSLNLIIN